MNEQINLYERLGNIQFQIDNLLKAKESTTKQIENMMIIESIQKGEEAE